MDFGRICFLRISQFEFHSLEPKGGDAVGFVNLLLEEVFNNNFYFSPRYYKISINISSAFSTLVGKGGTMNNQ